MGDFEALSNDELADQITTWAGRVAVAEARLLLLIGEFDEREAWAGGGLLSCAHWLSWRLGMGLVAARERVRVARRLRVLPVTTEAFQAGRLSWTQVRAITRAADAVAETELVELARHCTGAQLERLVRGIRRSLPANDPQQEQWRRRPRVSYEQDGTLVLTVRFPAEQAAVVLAALEAQQSELTSELTNELTSELTPELTPELILELAGASAEAPVGPRPTLADALHHLCRRALDRPVLRRSGRAKRRLTVRLDPLSGWCRLADGELLPPGVVERPDELRARRLRRMRPGDLTAHDLGRSARLPNDALRDLLGAVDGERCRLPGCTRVTTLHAHHVQHWADGGATDLANLVLVCSRHHTLIHTGELTVGLDPDRSVTVTDARGHEVQQHPLLPWRPLAEVDPDGTITAGTLPPQWLGDPLDLGHAVWVLRQHAA